MLRRDMLLRDMLRCNMLRRDMLRRDMSGNGVDINNNKYYRPQARTITSNLRENVPILNKI